MKKLFKILSLVLLLCIIFSGCNENASDSQNESIINIYLLENDEIAPIINDYNKSKGYQVIKITKFENLDILDAKLKSEIMAGAGPDLIYYNYSTNNQNIQKLIQSDYFTDLNELISNDASESKLNISDYNQVVMNSGVYGGKRIFFPLTYKVDTLATTRENCEKYNIDINNAFTLDKIDVKLKKFLQEQKSNKDMYACLPATLFFGILIESSVSFNEKDYNFQTQEFKEKFISLEKIYKKFDSGNDYNEIIRMINGDVLFTGNGYFTGNPYVSVQEAADFYALKVTPVMLSLSDNKNGLNSYVTSFLAINSNSKQKESAYDFIKFALSSKEQIKVETNAIPVNNAVYEKYIDKAEKYIDSEVHDNEKNSVMNFLDNYKKLISSISSCNVNDNYYQNIYESCLNDYLDKKIDYDTFINRLSSKTKIYLEE